MEREIKVKNITVLKDKAIIDVDGSYCYLVDFDKFLTSKSGFMITKDNIIYPSSYILWFDSYKENKDVIEFIINGTINNDDNFTVYELKGFINKEGNVSNCFEVTIATDKFEIYLRQEDCYDSNKIIKECLNSVETYYKPYLNVIYEDGTTKEVKHLEQ